MRRPLHSRQRSRLRRLLGPHQRSRLRRPLLLLLLLGLLVLSGGCGKKEPPPQLAGDSTSTASIALPTNQRIRERLLERRFERAADLARQRLQQRPADAKTRSSLVRALLEQGRSEEALAACDTLPSGPVRWGLKGEALLAMDEPAQAAAQLERARSVAPDDLHLGYLHGIALLRSGLPEVAIKTLEPLASLDPPYEESQLHLATALKRMGAAARADSVLGAYRAMLDRRQFLALRTEGLQRSEAGDLDVALDYFQRAYELNPDDPQLPNDLGVVYARKDDFQVAAEWFAKAVARDSTDAAAYRNLANAYHRLGDTVRRDRAAQRYQELLAQEKQQ